MATHEPSTTSPVTLGPQDDGRTLSAEAYGTAEFLGPWKYERVDGRLKVMSPDGEAHDDSSEPLRDQLGAYRLSHPETVEKVVSEAWVRVDDGTDRIADIGVYLTSERPRVPRPDRVPEIVFEIVSPGRDSQTRDYIEKRAEYLRLGVREYVIVDRLAGKVTVVAATPGGVSEHTLQRSQDYTSAMLPGLLIPLAEVLPE